LPSNVIIDKFDITKKAFLTKLGFFCLRPDGSGLNLIIAGSIV